MKKKEQRTAQQEVEAFASELVGKTISLYMKGNPKANMAVLAGALARAAGLVMVKYASVEMIPDAAESLVLQISKVIKEEAPRVAGPELIVDPEEVTH